MCHSSCNVAKRRLIQPQPHPPCTCSMSMLLLFFSSPLASSFTAYSRCRVLALRFHSSMCMTCCCSSTLACACGIFIICCCAVVIIVPRRLRKDRLQIQTLVEYFLLCGNLQLSIVKLLPPYQQ
jgi:hypothetical protein